MNKIWDTTRPIKELPKKISEIFCYEANNLFVDLKRNILQVELFPALEIRHVGHKIRRAVYNNPEWYKRIYHNNSFEAIYTNSKTKRKHKCLCSKIS